MELNSDRMIFHESGMNFAFDAYVIKYDEDKDYYKRFVEKLPETKAVDFLVDYHTKNGSGKLILLEVKNFELAGSERHERLSPTGDDPLHIEIGQKVRDTLAALMALGAHKQKKWYGKYKSFHETLMLKNELQDRLMVVAFIEGNLGQYKKGCRDGVVGLQRKIEEVLKWLNCEVVVLNTDSMKTAGIRWMSVE